MRLAACSAGMSSKYVSRGMMPPMATSPTRHTSSGLKAAGVPLIDHVGQQIAVADDDFARGERRANDFFDELCPGGHVEQHFAPAVDRCAVMVEQDFAQRLAQRRAARIAASRRPRGRAARSASAKRLICVDFPTPSTPSKLKNMKRAV